MCVSQTKRRWKVIPTRFPIRRASRWCLPAAPAGARLLPRLPRRTPAIPTNPISPAALSRGRPRGSRPRLENCLFARFVDFGAPAPVQPEPLLGILANPALDHAGNDLHGAIDVDLALGIARRFDRIGHLAAEAVARQTYHAYAMDRAVEMTGEPRQQRIGHGALAEKSYRHAAHVILI